MAGVTLLDRRNNDARHHRRKQIALAWLPAQKPWIAPIPGTTKFACLGENIDAASVNLGPEDLREIESAKFKVQSAHYPEEPLRTTGR